MKIVRRPEYFESLKTIKRSIQARGGIADERRVLESLVWNYYKHLAPKDKREIGLDAPSAWDTAGWVYFRTRLLTNPKLIALRELAEKNLQTAYEEKQFAKVEVFDSDGKPTSKLVLPGTKIQIG